MIILKMLWVIKYLLFYLLCGIIASLSHVFATKILGQNLLIPSLGASGAISGVLGAYILLFPRRRVTMFFVRFITHVSAFWAIGIWIVFQIVSGLGMLGGSDTGALHMQPILGDFLLACYLSNFLYHVAGLHKTSFIIAKHFY